MSGYHKSEAMGRGIVLPERVEISLTEIGATAKEGLLALAVGVGFQVLQAVMEEEVNRIVGPKGKHQPGRQAVRHGKEKGYVILGGRKVRIKRPRVRSTDKKEIPLVTYTTFQQEDPLEQAVLERVLYGLACRQYRRGLEPVGSVVEAVGTSKSAASRRLIKGFTRVLEELLSRPLDRLDLLALMIDGVVVAEHTAVVALGLDSDGRKHVLGLWEGATENATLCRSLLSGLVARGLRYEQGILVVIDGSRALRAAERCAISSVTKRWCNAIRCTRSATSWSTYLRANRPGSNGGPGAAWRENNPTKAKQKLLRLAEELEKDHPGAAASLREGLEETLTVQRLRLPGPLQKSLSSTNIIESALDGVRQATHNVKRWSGGKQVLRWVAAGLLVRENQFHRLAGYRELPLLRVALQREMLRRKDGEITPAYATA